MSHVPAPPVASSRPSVPPGADLPPLGPVTSVALSAVLATAGVGWLVVLHAAEGAVEHAPLPLGWHVLRDAVLALPLVTVAVALAALVVRRRASSWARAGAAVLAGSAAAVALVAGGPAHAWLFEAPHGHEAGHAHPSTDAVAGLPVTVHAARDLLLVLPVTLIAARVFLLLVPEARRTAGASRPAGRVLVGVAVLVGPAALRPRMPQEVLAVRPPLTEPSFALLQDTAVTLLVAVLVAGTVVRASTGSWRGGARGRRLLRWGLPLGLAGLLGTVAYADVPEASLLRDRVSPCFDDSPVGRPFTQAMPIPPVATGVRTPTSDVYHLVEQRSETEIVPGVKTPVWGYNGIVPGPTLLAEKGRPTEVTFTNDLPPGEDPSSIILKQPPSEEHHFEPSSTSVHLHGINADHLADGYPDDGDGHPHMKKSPGDSRTHHYPNNEYQRPATYWYHDHSVHITSNHVYRGLAGFYLLQETAEEQAALNLPKGYGVHDIPLVLKDVMIDPKTGKLIYDNCSHMGAYGDVMTVNGKQQPKFDVGNRKYRFRMLDGGDARQFMPALRTLANVGKPVDDPRANEPFMLIGTDHGLLQHPEAVKSVHLSPSERVELVVDFSKYPVGTRLVMVNLLADPSDRKLFPLMAFDVARVEPDESTVPPVLRPFVQHPADEQPPAQVRTFRFGKNNGTYWSINGQIFNPLRDDARPLLDTTEDWVLDNRSGGWGHPVHLHLGRFQIMKIEGRAPRPGELQGWKDTVWLGPNQRITVRHQFWNYPGRFVFHCHNSSHEDFDMMSQFNVQPNP